MVTVEDVAKSFGNVKAVDGISFKVKPGEIVGLLGPNGAGKSTTMRMLTGYLTPDRGNIEIDGINVFDNPVSAQEIIGYLPENNPLYKDMLVSDFLSFSGDLKHITGNNLRDAVDFAVTSVNIEDVYYRPISELSKGFKQRVGLAVALLHKPKFLIMDEPSEGLDPNQRTEIRTLIKKLAKEHTIIVSTHVMQEVEAVCSRMIIISKGRIVADGTPRELTRKAGTGRTLSVELEGKDIEKHLRTLKTVHDFEAEKLKDGKVRAVLTVGKDSLIQPELSKLAAKNNWIIWKLAEDEKHLEDVFHLLTQEK